MLARRLKHLDIVNIGAAGTFVIRKPVTRSELRAALVRCLPFETEVMICHGRDVVRVMSQDYFAGQPTGPDVVRFVSVLSKRPRLAPPMPISMPSPEDWLLKVVGREDRFVFGLYRRHMKAIGYLGALDRIFGVPATTRNWNTITAVTKLLQPG
jgi:hypothetical protein